MGVPADPSELYQKSIFHAWIRCEAITESERNDLHTTSSGHEAVNQNPDLKMPCQDEESLFGASLGEEQTWKIQTIHANLNIWEHRSCSSDDLQVHFGFCFSQGLSLWMFDHEGTLHGICKKHA